MVAHVSDFGIARLVSAIGGTSQKNSSTIGVKGTVGYSPPGMFYMLEFSLFFFCFESSYVLF